MNNQDYCISSKHVEQNYAEMSFLLTSFVPQSANRHDRNNMMHTVFKEQTGYLCFVLVSIVHWLVSSVCTAQLGASTFVIFLCCFGFIEPFIIAKCW